MAKQPRRVYRLVEFYSGIGGMRFAMEASGIPYVSVAAIDVNPVVNSVYCYNFGSQCHQQRNIESFQSEEIDKFDADIFALSPPCQPFTRLGLKLDSEDARSQSFLHLLRLFRKLKKKPLYVFIENVMGFEQSAARSILTSTLQECGYTYQEFLLSPAQCNIPNSRLRYYIVAKLKPLKFAFPVLKEVLRNWPLMGIPLQYPCEKCNDHKQSKMNMENRCIIRHFLEEKPEDFLEPFLLSEKLLKKHAFVLDIVEEDSPSSCCFTKAYGRYVQGTGSVLHPAEAPKVSEIYNAVERAVNAFPSSETLTLLCTLRLRYFTPQEVANLMCFPQEFRFPDDLSKKQKYKALGNSVNVFIVSRLFLMLFAEK